MFKYKICYHVALRANAHFYKIQEFTFIDLLLKLTSSVSIFFNIQIGKLFKIIFYMVFNLNHQHFVSRQSYAKHKYFCIFPRYSILLADLPRLMYLIIETCMKLKRTKISKDVAH